jgi:hypothetical protein
VQTAAGPGSRTRHIPAPVRDGLAVAAGVLVAYLVFFAVRLLQGHALEPDHVAAQIGFQTVGVGSASAFASWLVRRLW